MWLSSNFIPVVRVSAHEQCLGDSWGQAVGGKSRRLEAGGHGGWRAGSGALTGEQTGPGPTARSGALETGWARVCRARFLNVTMLVT